MGLQGLVIDSLKHWFVIFIDQNNDSLTCLFISPLYNTGKAQRQSRFSRPCTINGFPIRQSLVQYTVKTIRRIILSDIKVHMENRMPPPLLFKFLHRQSLKKFFFPLKIRFKRRNEQTLPKTAGAAKKIVATCLDHFIDECSLINIKITSQTKFLKILYTDGINLVTHNLLEFKKFL